MYRAHPTVGIKAQCTSSFSPSPPPPPLLTPRHALSLFFFAHHRFRRPPPLCVLPFNPFYRPLPLAPAERSFSFQPRSPRNESRSVTRRRTCVKLSGSREPNAKVLPRFTRSEEGEREQRGAGRVKGKVVCGGESLQSFDPATADSEARAMLNGGSWIAGEMWRSQVDA